MPSQEHTAFALLVIVALSIFLLSMDGLRDLVTRMQDRRRWRRVKDAVEKAFDVTVVDVNILIMAAKTSRRGSAIRIRRPKWKKAVVTLQTGDRIQLFEGV